ncbi:MAG: hypothetical protein ABIU63_12555 [Chitinophagaceae bacterium]
MKKIIRIVVIAGCLVAARHIGFAQSGKLDTLFLKGDTTAVMDSLMSGFDAYLDSMLQEKSFLSASVGVGNRTFSIKNNSLNTQETSHQLSFTPTLAYYHKSGLGLSATGFLANPGNGFHFYQYAVTPSYDYISTSVSTGISYTRYFGKDTAMLNASPYENDLYGYVNLHHKSWRYGIAAGYATGSFNDKITYEDSVYRYSNLLQRYGWVHIRKTIESQNHIKDFSLSASVRRDFSLDGLFTKNDNCTISLTGYLVSGVSKIKTNTNINYATKKIALSKFKRSYDSADGNDFQVQSVALAASIFYTIGKFNIQPLWYMDYYLQDTEQRFSQVFALTLSFSL